MSHSGARIQSRVMSCPAGRHTCAVFQRTYEQQVHCSADCTDCDPDVTRQVVCHVGGSCNDCANQHDNY